MNYHQIFILILCLNFTCYPMYLKELRLIQDNADRLRSISITTDINMIAISSILGIVWGISQNAKNIENLCLRQQKEMQELKKEVSHFVKNDVDHEFSSCSEMSE